MSPVELATIEKNYKELREGYHLALDMLEAKTDENTKLRKEIMQLKTEKKPDA